MKNLSKHIACNLNLFSFKLHVFLLLSQKQSLHFLKKKNQLPMNITTNFKLTIPSKLNPFSSSFPGFFLIFFNLFLNFFLPIWLSFFSPMQRIFSVNNEPPSMCKQASLIPHLNTPRHYSRKKPSLQKKIKTPPPFAM